MSSGQVGSVDVVPDAALHAISPTSPAADTSVIEVPPTAAAIDHTRANLHGVLLGLAAAVTYSIANLALRGLAKTDSGLGWSMWVAGTKAFPMFFVAVILIATQLAMILSVLEMGDAIGSRYDSWSQGAAPVYGISDIESGWIWDCWSNIGKFRDLPDRS